MFYRKVVIDMKTLKDVEVHPVLPKGEIALCGGSGGGGSSGKVSYPAYIETFHGQALDDGAGDALSYSLADHMNTAHTTNPLTGTTAYDPQSRLDDAWLIVDDFETIVDALNDTADWTAFLAAAVHATDGVKGKFEAPTLDAAADIASAWLDPSPDAPSDIASAWVDPAPDADGDIGTDWIDPAPAAEDEIGGDVDAYRAIVDDHFESNVLPRFQRGMQDINAVMSSAFTIGQAIIEGMASRDINKYQGTLRVAAFTQKDQIHAASRLGESNRLADAHIQNDRLLTDGKIGESRSLAEAHIQDDKLLAEGKNRESEALAEAHKQDDKINADSLKLKNLLFLQAIDQMVRYYTTRIQANTNLAQTVTEVNRISIVAEKEEADQQIFLDTSEAGWDLEMWAYAGNLIAGISGGTYMPGKPSRMQSALGGAMGGAAMGAAAGAGNPWAIGAGALIGAYMGYMG